MNFDADDTREFVFEWQIEFDASGLTNVGKVRDNNEDQFLIVELEKHATVLSSSFEVDDSEHVLNGSRALVMIVADGVGGSAAGERASQLAAEEVLRHLRENMPWFMRLHHEHEDELIDALKGAVRKCELAVELEGQLVTSESGMGTTLTLAYVIWPSLYVVHVGDSRCYIQRDSGLFQVTRDHTYGQALLEAGQLDKHEAKTSKFSNVLLNSIGRGMEELHPEVYTSELQDGDRILLCTDGVTDTLEDEKIVGILENSTDSGQACNDLIQAGLDAGGHDNLTAVVCVPNLKLDDES